MKILYSADVVHANNFDFVRVLLATTVVFHHSYLVYDGNIYRDPLWIWSDHQLSSGTWAVNFFFAISGFLISQSWERDPQYVRFLQNRIFRIYPAFIAVSLLGALLFAPLGRGWPTAFLAYWSEIRPRGLLFMIATLRESILPPTFMSLPFPNTLNLSLWSISYEFVCYQLLPLAALMGAGAKPVRILGIFATVLVLNIAHHHAYQIYNVTGKIDLQIIPYYPAAYYERLLNLEHLLLPFTAGMCFYSYRHHVPRSRLGLLFSLLVLVVTLRSGVGFEMAQAVFGTYVLLYFIFQQHVSLHGFAKFGDFSYGIYLYGWPILQLLLLYARVPLTVWSLFTWTMSLVLPIAALSWHLIEKPALRLKRLTLLQVGMEK
jgi:peptidoglycan/LPS O-acetylase OafA/YrhL